MTVHDMAVREVKLFENVSYIPASEAPLSADVVIFRGADGTWLFDVGSDEEVAAYLAKLPKKRAIISHFHADHAGNLTRFGVEEVYGGRETVRHAKMGKIVQEPTVLKAEIGGMSEFLLLPLPSSHAKGSLALRYRDVLFVGDGLYGNVKEGYNLQLLYQTIQTLQGQEVKYIALSHSRRFLHPYAEVLDKLKRAYAARELDGRLLFEE